MALNTIVVLGGNGKIPLGDIPVDELPGGVTLAEVKADVDVADALAKRHGNSLDHDGGAQDAAIAGKTTLAIVKADVDIASAISLKHNSSLDHDGSVQDSAIAGKEPANANIQAHVTSVHAPSNAQKNSDITEAEIEAKLTGEVSSHFHPGGGGESEVTVVKTSDTANATTTLANVGEMTFDALANSLYVIEVFLLWVASLATVGLKVSASATGSPTVQSGLFIAEAANGTPDSNSWAANDGGLTTSASPYATPAICFGKVLATLKTGASAGVWTLRFAAETTGTITVKAGSVLRYRKVA